MVLSQGPNVQAGALLKLSVIARSAQLTAHNFHNTNTGPTWASDHAFFADLYSTYEGIYDDLIERLIGTGSPPDLIKVQQFAVQRLKKVPISVEEMFSTIAMIEEEIREVIEDAAESNELSQGVLNLLAGIADESEKRSYKVQQRLA